MAIQERGEALLQRRHDARREAPHVHGDWRVAGQHVHHAAIVAIGAAAVVGLDAFDLADPVEQSVRGDPAQAPVHAAVPAERLAQRKADQRVRVGLGRGAQKLRQRREGLRAVEVVGVHDTERRREVARRHEHRVRRAPRLGARRGDSARAPQVLEALDGITDRHAGAEAAAHGLVEHVLGAVANHQHHVVETGADRVVDEVIADGGAAGTHLGGVLLAAITATHSGGENDQRWGHGE